MKLVHVCVHACMTCEMSAKHRATENDGIGKKQDKAKVIRQPGEGRENKNRKISLHVSCV